MTEKQRKELFDAVESWHDFRPCIDLNLRQQMFKYKGLEFIRILVLEHALDWRKTYEAKTNVFADRWREKALYQVKAEGKNVYYIPVSHTEALKLMKERDNERKLEHRD